MCSLVRRSPRRWVRRHIAGLLLCAGCTNTPAPQDHLAPAADAGPEDDCELDDPDFERVTDPELNDAAQTWRISEGGAVVQNEGDTWVEFSGPALCAQAGSVSQSIGIPRQCNGFGPAVLFNQRTGGGAGAGGVGGVRVGGLLQPAGGSFDEAFCLGDSLLGTATDLTLVARALRATLGTDCTDVGASAFVALTRGQLVALSTCTAPGVVSPLEHWRIVDLEEPDRPVEPPLVLSTPFRSQTLYAFPPNEAGASIPSAFERPMIAISATGTIAPGAKLSLYGGYGVVRRLEDARFCLPGQRRGHVVPLGLALFAAGGPSIDEDGSIVTVDGIALLDDPTFCAGADDFLLDPEITDDRYWDMSSIGAAMVEGSAAGDVDTGRGAIELTMTTPCDGGGAGILFDTPTESVGRALEITFSLDGGTPEARLSFEVLFTNTRGSFASTGGAEEVATTCLDSHAGGQLTTISFWLQNGDLQCDAAAPQVRARIESVRVVASPGCT